MNSNADMRAFVRVVERGSFTTAATDLGITPSAISKLVTRLEDRLGVRLLHRTTRRVALTAEGETYHLRARDILAAIEDAETEVSRAGQAPRGRLRVNCVFAFALHELAPALPDFLDRNPGVEVELVATDRVVDLLAEHTDVGIRTGTVIDPSLVARKISTIHRGIFAAPDYLARRGTPVTPDELIDHECIVLNTMPHWPFRENGTAKSIQPMKRLVVDNSDVALRLALAGAGIVRLGDILVGSAVRDGRLVPLFTDNHVFEVIPLSVVYPEGRHRMPKVRAFVDFLMERFAHAPWRPVTSRAAVMPGKKQGRVRRRKAARR